MDEICKTKYPIVLVHGVGFRDLKWPVYWGRITKILEAHGANIYYGLQDCWASTDTNAKVLAKRVDEILAESGSEKVNLIGHSKGGLEARMVASSLGMAEKVASITTIATPHYGSKTVSKLLKAPKWIYEAASFVVDHWIKIIGDREPAFMTVCQEFSEDHMKRFNDENPDVAGVFYQSYACVMNHPFSDITLSTANFIVKIIEGENDGLVTVRSASWGKDITVLRSATRRGISHVDAIDVRRIPFSHKREEGKVSDIAEVYVAITQKIKRLGY